MQERLQRILTFTQLLSAYRNVERMIPLPGSDRKENDQEHSYSLAMLAWYIADTHQLTLNREKLLKYALVHDIVEVYAGDTYLYTTDTEKRNSKHQREQEAAERLKKEFPEFEEMHTLIHQYEHKTDEESKFIYALDKIEPMLYIYLDNGRMYREENISLEMILEHKKEKVALSQTTKEIFEEMIELLKENKEMFGKK